MGCDSVGKGIEGPKGGGKLLAFIGLGFWQAWWMVAMCTDALLPDPSESPFPMSLTVLLLLLSCLGYLAVVIAREWGLKRLLGVRGVGIATAVLAVSGSLGMGIVAHGDLLGVAGGSLFICAAAAFSVGNALLLMTWGSLWSTLATGYVGRLLCASYTAAFALFFIVRELPLGIAIAVCALLPIASLVGYFFARKAPRRKLVARKDIAWKELPVGKALVALFAANLIWGISQKYLYVGAGDTSDYSFVFAAFCMLAFTAFMFIVSPTDEPAALLKPIVPALVCGIAIMIAMPAEDMFLGEGIMIYGGYCLDMLIMLVASDIAFRMQRPVVRVFGIALFVARAGSLIGTMIGEWCITVDVTYVAIAMLCIVVLMVAGTLLFSQVDLDRFYRVQAGPASDGAFEEKCAAIAELYGLTSREHEVLDLLARGRSAPFIGQELSIALGTTKNHISSIYRKIGVSDRQSLHNVIERV